MESHKWSRGTDVMELGGGAVPYEEFSPAQAPEISFLVQSWCAACARLIFYFMIFLFGLAFSVRRDGKLPVVKH